MATSTVVLRVRVSDFASVKLLVLQLEMLAAEMRVGANPAAEALTKILDRWNKRLANDDDVPEDAE